MKTNTRIKQILSNIILMTVFSMVLNFSMFSSTVFAFNEDDVAYEQNVFMYTHYDADGTICGGSNTTYPFQICGCTYPDGKKVMTHYQTGTEYIKQYNCSGEVINLINTGKSATCYTCKSADDTICGYYTVNNSGAETYGSFCTRGGKKKVEGTSCTFINEGPIIDVRTEEMKGSRCCSDKDKDIVFHCNDNCPDVYNPDQKDSDSNGIGDACENSYSGEDKSKTKVNCDANNVADPINIFNGNLFEKQTDLHFNSAFKGGLSLQRYYNNRNDTQSIIGFGWTHNFNNQLSVNTEGSYTQLTVIDGTGRGYFFYDYDDSNTFKETGNQGFIIVNDEGDYVWLKTTGESYIFDSEVGTLLSAIDLNGNTQALSYKTDGLLESVTDQSTGRTLTFHYNTDSRIIYVSGPVTVAVPDGIWVSYEYDANGNLTKATYADDNNGSTASGFEYRYEDPNDPNNMTAKYDLAGNLIATWNYDDQDRAVENTNWEGIGATINYDDPESVVVTDAYGLINTYTINTIGGRKKITAKTGAKNCNTCSTGIIRAEFDEQTGMPIEREWVNGRVDQFLDYGENLNAGTHIISVGTDEEKTIYTKWHAELSTPLTRTHKSLLADDTNPDRNRVTIWDYDDPSADGDTDTPNENPTNNIYRMILQGYTHDSSGSVIAFEQVTTYTYNDKGQVLTVDGPLTGTEDVVTFSYDPTTGDLLSITRPITGTTSFTYDDAGNVLTATDENQIQTVFTYDGRNRWLTATSENASTVRTFTAAGEPETLTDRSGRTQTLSYNTNGFLQRLTNPAGDYQRFAYDENANPIESSIYTVGGVQTLFKGFDYGDPSTDPELAPGKPAIAKHKNQDGTADLNTQFAYEYGNLVRVTDPMGTVNTYHYDTLGRMYQMDEQQTDTITANTSYGYDLNNNLIKVTDPENLVTEYVYDDANRLVTEISPDTGTTRYVYDDAGNLKIRIANDQSMIRYDYDALGRRTGTQYENADQDILYFYDSGINGKGRLTSISHDQEFYNFAYNTLGHLTQVQRTTSFATFTTSFAYDEDGRLESMVYPDGRTVIYGRDTAGNINQVTTAKDGESTTLATDVTYRPFGPATGLTLGNGQEISISYDLNYNPLSINASGALDYSYGYDLASRISSITDNLDSSKSRGFDYDRAGRLTSATGPFGNMTFSYDKTGNRQSTVNDEVTTSFGYDPGSNRLVSITDPDTQTDLTYDDNGRPLTRGDMSYSYTDAGRLATVSEQNAVLAEYVYNSMGQRTSKTIGDKTTVYHYDLEGNLIAESTPEGDFYIDYVYMGQTRLAALASDPDDVFEVSVSTTTGQSVEGIKVYAFTPSGSYTGIYAVTDALGTAVFQSTNLSGTSFKFRADYLTEQFWTETVELTAGSTTLTIQDVDQTVSIIQSGSAVAGVKVYVFDENGRYLGIWGVTDDQGQVSFALPMGYDYQFRADNMGNQYFSQTIEADGEETQIDTQGGILSVNLTRDDSQPITGVKAYLFSESGTYLGQSTTTDIQGGALFSLPSGTYKVRFDYLGYKFWSESIEVTSDTTASVVIPHNELTLSVTKTMAAASEPVAGIKTYLFTESGTYLGISKTTDSTGKAVFLVPEKAYKIRGDYLSGQYWSQPFTWTDPAIAIAQGTVTLTISNVGQPLADVKTYVFSEQGQYLGVNGQSLANGEVSFTLPQGIYTFRADWLNNQYWSDPVTITADQAVAYELSTGGGTVTMTATDGQNPLEGLKTYVFNASGTYLGQNSTTDNAGQVSFTLGQGTYKMRLDYMGSQFWSNEVTIPDDTSINLIVPHTQLTAIVKGVNDGQESALSGIKAYLFSESGTYLGINQTTDENGQVVFKLPNLAFKLRADYLSDQYWSESFTGTNPVIDIGLGTATVKVGSDSSSLAGVKVYVFDSDGTYMGLSAATSEEGTAVFTLPPGTWKFRADYLGSQYWAEGSVIADQDNAIDVDPGGGSIALTVEKPAGQVLAGVKVYAFSSSESYLGLNQTTTDEGIVSFELPEGEYKFRADYLGYKFWTDVLSVPETVSQSLTIPHEDVVVSVAGQYQSAFAVQGVKTYLFSASGSYMGLNATTDANGQVVYSLPNQAYKVRADYLGNQYWSDQIDQTDTTVTIDYGQTMINVSQAGIPIAGARVYLFSEAGSYLGQVANTDDTGNASFILPVNSYKFRIDHSGSQYWSESMDLIAQQNLTIDLDLDLMASNLTANPHYARYDGEMPQKEETSIFLASIGSLAGYVDSSAQPGLIYYLNDHLGTPIVIINDEGQVVWEGSYAPFGQVSQSVNTAQNQFRFPGQYFDGETGMHYNWHRYYDPDTGRYLTSDPIGLAGGINPFVYALNNPINIIDPEGLHGIVFFGRGPYINIPRFLRNFPKRFRPKKPPKEKTCDPQYEPTRAPNPEELGLPPDDLWWQQDPGRGFLKPKSPKYNPKNPPKKNMPPLENGGDEPRKPWEQPEIPYA